MTEMTARELVTAIKKGSDYCENQDRSNCDCRVKCPYRDTLCNLLPCNGDECEEVREFIDKWEANHLIPASHFIVDDGELIYHKTGKCRDIPDHYQLDPEPVEVIKAWGLNFCLGNVVKYVARAGRKEGETADSDLHKAMQYLRIELENM